MKEFELINTYFTEQLVNRRDVVVGIGDDCAVITPAEKQNIAITTDTLIAGVHFPKNTPAKAIGHKAVAVNLSDLAAMGAEPTWISIAISLPEIDEDWISNFCEGMFALCEFYNVQLIGGDTTQGPLSITITAQGVVPVNKQICRSGAKAGDWIYVTGELGDAALALKHYYGDITLRGDSLAYAMNRLNEPKPRVLAGQAVREYASAAIDISDGLLADLSHICKASNVGANIVLEDLPLSDTMLTCLGAEKAMELALSGGDDYELLLAVSEDNKVGMETTLADMGTKVTCIGQLNGNHKITTTLNNKPTQLNVKGFEHFANE
ncbi:thiamine-phosphate kinase [Thalassotalea sp. 1_MG-2023]|uniref:thiamine-phosphate kinase n=1 Tax=Thalassotalea sp. 1_MG-2023 TaxID=3062680 RepID=UPI0026E174B8|nr:thiamine-phosphate kinase [Thalassotalea sp. 1_MG-2023]MDO6426519.1 thiamine-phosphate kinase [Thalassotalea sp. 1_MG-2023]